MTDEYILSILGPNSNVFLHVSRCSNNTSVIHV